MLQIVQQRESIAYLQVFMMVFTIAAVGIFQNSVALGLSYGVCVSTLMLGTDLLIALGMVVVWELHPLFSLSYLCVFGFIDSVFFTANLTKIPKGRFSLLVIPSSLSNVLLKNVNFSARSFCDGSLHINTAFCCRRFHNTLSLDHRIP